mgnify:CR=1 FL=1
MNLEKHVLVGTNKEELVNQNFHALQKQKKYHQSVLLKEQAQKHHTHWNLTIKTILNLIMKLGSILILKVSLKKAFFLNEPIFILLFIFVTKKHQIDRLEVYVTIMCRNDELSWTMS